VCLTDAPPSGPRLTVAVSFFEPTEAFLSLLWRSPAKGEAYWRELMGPLVAHFTADLAAAGPSLTRMQELSSRTKTG